MFGCRGFREKCCAGRLGDPASVFFVVMRLVCRFLLPRLRDLTVEWKVMTRRPLPRPHQRRAAARPTDSCPVCPAFGCETGRRKTRHGDVSQKGVMSAFKCPLSFLLLLLLLYICLCRMILWEMYRFGRIGNSSDGCFAATRLIEIPQYYFLIDEEKPGAIISPYFLCVFRKSTLL